MKRAALIGIIFILAYSQAGYYFVMRSLQYRQKEIVKGRILRSLNRDELEVISLEDNKHYISWEEDEKEFLFKGEMYDVVERKVVNGKVMLYCINDKKEKQLISNYNLITKHNSSSGKKGKSISSNSINLFIDQQEEQNIYTKLHKDIFPSFSSGLQSVISQKESPPPKA